MALRFVWFAIDVLREADMIEVAVVDALQPRNNEERRRRKVETHRHCSLCILRATHEMACFANKETHFTTNFSKIDLR